MNSDLFQMLKLILKRNELAKIRSSKRGLVGRLHKKLDAGSRENKDDTEELTQKIIAAEKMYREACKELAIFTRVNRPFRSDMRKKYKTMQRNSASNHVSSLSFEIDGQRLSLDEKQIKSTVLSLEIDNILLGG